MFKKFSIEILVWGDVAKIRIASMLNNFHAKFETSGLENRTTHFIAKVTETQLDEIVSYASASNDCSVKLLLKGGLIRLYVLK